MTFVSTSFDHQPKTRLVYGVGSIRRLGSLTRDLGKVKAALVTDRGLVSAGHADTAENSLRQAGVSVVRFDQVDANPTTAHVEACREFFSENAPDIIIALGGGSPIDCAKGANLVHSCGGRMEDYWGVGKATAELLPMIAIPTTAGTGSEVQSFALVANESTRQKMACGDPRVAPKIALLDPELTLSTPRSVSAHTGLDAVTHAVESAVSRKRNAISNLYAVESFRLASRALPRIFVNPRDIESRGQMLLASSFAGLAIENSMLGAAHSMANPLHSHFEVIHGVAVGSLIPSVVRYNRVDPEASKIYRVLSRVAGLGRHSDDLESFLVDLLDRAAITPSLKGLGVLEASLPQMAEEASNQWTAQFNPRTIGPAEFLELYRGAFESTR